MNVQGFLQSLEIMGLGMLGIFVVMLLIFLVILLLGRLSKPKDEDGGDE